MTKSEGIRKRLEEQQAVLAELEAELRAAEKLERQERWFPQGFYLAYYVLAGAVLGALASWITLGLNVIGAAVVGLEDPLRLLRVYATIIGGEATASSNEAVVIVFAIGLHTITGIICGTPIHVVYSRFFGNQKLVPRLVTGFLLGIVMWLVNFYGILTWLQPLITGGESSYIVSTIPPWVAAGTHIAFTEVMVLLQPLAVFSPEVYPREAAIRGDRSGRAATP